MLNINEQDHQVSKFLADNNIPVTHQFLGFCDKVNGQDWQADRFLVKFKNVEFNFNVGIGNRLSNNPTEKGCYSGSTKCKSALKELKDMYSNCEKVTYLVDFIPTKFDKTYRNLAVAPTPARVLYCLLADSGVNDYSFNDWCDCFGYDNDSIETFNTYQACCNTGKELLKVFSRAQIETLRDMLQDY